MSDMPGASVSIVENPFGHDPNEQALDAVNLANVWLAECDPEIGRMTSKLARAQAEAEHAQSYVDEAEANKVRRTNDLAAAEAARDAQAAADPDGMAAAVARADTARKQRITELKAELNKLKGA